MREAALLLRCSTNLQDYNRQKNDLLALADKLGFSVRDEYIFGEYVTGKDDIRKGNRQSVQSLIDACLERMVDAGLTSLIVIIKFLSILGIKGDGL